MSDVPKPASSRKAGRDGRRRADAARELAAELRMLRSLMRTMLRRYELDVGGRIEALIERADGGDAALEERPRLPTLRQTAAARQVLGELRLKPEKGRSKDFGRLERGVAALHELLES